MHADGGLKAGQVSAGLHEQQRSDLMAWLPAAAELQPAQIGQLLHALDRLMLALCEMPQLSEDLGGVALLRGEAQCTVYPGGGSRYIRHTDDARCDHHGPCHGKRRARGERRLAPPVLATPRGY